MTASRCRTLAALMQALLFATQSMGLASPAPGRSISSPGHFPLYFEPNLGQTDHQVRFLARSGGTTLFLTADEAVFRLQSRAAAAGCGWCAAHGQTAETPGVVTSVVRIALRGASRTATIEALIPIPGRSNYYRGARHLGSPIAVPARFAGHTAVENVPHFAQVLYHNVYEGIDLVYHGGQGALEYDFRVQPGADPGRIRLTISGATSKRLTDNGSLEISTPAGKLVQHAPVVYQTVGGKRLAVESAFLRRADGTIGFRLGRYDRSRPLVIDPILSYGAEWGGTADDAGNAVAVDKDGNILVTGKTASADFPTKNAINDTFHGPTDCFVTKIAAAGNAIVYSTYFSGQRNVAGNAIAVDGAGNAYVTGFYDKATEYLPGEFSYDQDLLMFELGPNGQHLQGVYFGGTADDAGYGIALGQDGSIYVAGASASWDNPDTPANEGMPVTANAFQPARAGSQDAYICRVDPGWQTFIYGTYLGGPGNLVLETAAAIAVDAAGDAFVTGKAGPGFWVTPASAAQTDYGGGLFDAYLTEITPDGTGLVYSTLLGGEDFDEGTGVALDNQGVAYISGITYSLHLPVTPNAAQPALHYGNCNPDIYPFYQCSDSFVTKIDTTKAGAASLAYSTYLGGTKEDDAAAIAVDSHGNAWVTGRILDIDFPEVNPLPTKGLGWEAFVTQVAPDGRSFPFSTYLGGKGTDWAHGITINGADNVYVTGETDSDDFPLTTAIQQTPMGGHNVFVVKIGAGQLTPGDVNGDGTFDARDVVKALRDAAGLDASGGGEVQRGDMADPTGRLTLEDAAALVRKLSGL